jgi:hypothetical protein
MSGYFRRAQIISMELGDWDAVGDAFANFNDFRIEFEQLQLERARPTG